LPHQRYRQTDRQDINGLIAQGEPFYKLSPKNKEDNGVQK